MNRFGKCLWQGSIIACALLLASCANQTHQQAEQASSVPVVGFHISRNQPHYKLSRLIPAVMRVPSSAVIEAYASEASDRLISADMTTEEYRQLKWPDDFGRPLTGPVYVEGAEPGDTLAVTLHKIELRDWGWKAKELPDLKN